MSEEKAAGIFGKILFGGPRNLICLAVFILIILAGWQGWKWMTGRDHLRVDNLTLFESPEKLKERYPCAGFTYVGSVGRKDFLQPKVMDDASAPAPYPIEYFASVDFKPLRPGAEVSRVVNAQMDKAMKSNGSEKYDPAALEKVKLFTLSARLDFAGQTMEKFLNYFYQDPSILSALAGPGTSLIEIDPANAHVLKFGNAGDAVFTDDYSSVTFGKPTDGKLTRLDKLPPVDLKGFYVLHLKLVDTKGTPAHLQKIINRKFIKMDVPAYFDPQGTELGKCFLHGKTYKMRGYKDPSGGVKIFLDQDHFIVVNSGASSFAYINGNFEQFAGSWYSAYVASLEKIQLAPEKEAMIKAHYAELGTVPQTVKDIPGAWACYYDSEPYVLTQVDWRTDEQWSQIFPDDIQMKMFLARLPEGNAKPETAEPKSTPPPKTALAQKPKANAPAQSEDDAILQSMKDKYKRRTNK